MENVDNSLILHLRDTDWQDADHQESSFHALLPGIHLTSADKLCLAELRKQTDFYSYASLQHFYHTLTTHPNPNDIWFNQNLLDEFRESQQLFFDCICSQQNNKNCIEARKAAWQHLYEHGFSATGMLGAYANWLNHVETIIVSTFQDSDTRVLESYNSVLKLVLIDITLSFNNSIAQDHQRPIRYLKAIVDHAADGLISIDESGTIFFCNNSSAKMFGYELSDLLGNNLKVLMPEYYAMQHGKFVTRYVESGASNVIGEGMREIMGKHKDGHHFPLDISISETMIGNKRVFIGVMRDCTERKKDHSQMLKLSSAIEQSADSIIITNYSGVIEYVNSSFSDVTGYAANEAIGHTPNILKSDLQDETFYKNLWKTILKGQVFRDVVINRKRDGTIYYEEKTITPLLDEYTGSITHFISTGKDITERMQAQKRLHYLAYYDVLTELPNRSLYMERLNSSIKRAERRKQMSAVMMLNLDRFKVINDTLGHEVGDSLLKGITKRLSNLIRKEDTIAHFGGDTFAILIEELKKINDIPDFIQKINDNLKNSFNLNNYDLYTTVSIGVSVFPQDGTDASTLVKNAEVAMYRVKSTGRNAYQFYTADMNEKALLRLEYETRLRTAIANEEFLLYYQPQVDLRTRKITGLEALVRWRHPDLGLIPPNDFIPLLEETGLIVSAGEWILNQACAQNKTWRDMGLPLVHVSVNLSPLQFRQRNLSKVIARILEDNQLLPQALELELTESSIMQNDVSYTHSLDTLNRMGISLAIDDFGMGYSCLNYLKDIPVNVIKLDKSFVDGLPDNMSDVGITRAIIAMAHSLNMRVIAEGVETEEQLKFLQQENCDVIQGFLFSRPVPATDIPELLNSGKQL